MARLPTKLYPAPGYLTTPQVLQRLGLTFRQLNYMREETTLRGIFGGKAQRREWPDEVVVRLEIAVALNRAVRRSNVRHSGLPAIAQSVLDGPDPPRTGWVVYDGEIRYGATLDQLVTGRGGIVAAIPNPYQFGERPAVEQGWAVVQSR